MAPTKRYAKKHAKATQRRRRTAQERLQRAQHQAHQAIAALEQALQEVGLPDNLVKEIEGRLRRQQKRLGNIFGGLFPSLFGCRTPTALVRVRGWDKNLPLPMVGALPKRAWLQRLRRLGLDVLAPWWCPIQDMSPATHRRWPWPGGADDAVCNKDGQPLGLGGTGWSGQEKRVRPGMAGGLLVVVLGAGNWVVPVDFAIRRPDPQGPGAPCRDQRSGVHVRLEERLAALGRRGLVLPPPVVVAARWCGDSKWMRPVSHHPQGTL